MNWPNTILAFIGGLRGKNDPPTEIIVVPKPHSTYTLDPETLRQRLKTLVTEPSYQPHPSADNPKETETHCNFFVSAVSEWYGIRAFNFLRANQIHEYMKQHPKEWIQVAGSNMFDYSKTIEAATQGCLLISAQTNPEGHGHVCIIAPEPNGEKSGSWGKTVPFAANVGQTCWYGQRLSMAFKQEPETYLYMGS